MHFKLNTALLFAATASALQVTSPTKGTKLDLSKSNELTWSSVESDPTSFDIELVNEHINPPVSKTIATNVQTSAGSYTFNSMSAAVGEGYQINLISNEQQNTGILAQSPNFDVSDASGISSTVSATFTTTTASSSSSSTSSSTDTSSSTITGSTSISTSLSSKTATGIATKMATASSSGVSSSATSQPSTGSANAVGVSAAVGGILGGGVLALLM